MNSCVLCLESVRVIIERNWVIFSAHVTLDYTVLQMIFAGGGGSTSRGHGINMTMETHINRLVSWKGRPEFFTKQLISMGNLTTMSSAVRILTELNYSHYPGKLEYIAEKDALKRAQESQLCNEQHGFCMRSS